MLARKLFACLAGSNWLRRGREELKQIGNNECMPVVGFTFHLVGAILFGLSQVFNTIGDFVDDV